MTLSHNKSRMIGYAWGEATPDLTFMYELHPIQKDLALSKCLLIRTVTSDLATQPQVRKHPQATHVALSRKHKHKEFESHGYIISSSPPLLPCYHDIRTLKPAPPKEKTIPNTFLSRGGCHVVQEWRNCVTFHNEFGFV